MKKAPHLLLFAYLAILSATQGDATEECEAPGPSTVDSEEDMSTELQCSLYLAESSIEGAGLGIFTAIPKERGESIGYGDVCIPFKDFYWQNYEIEPNPFKDYFWAGKAMGMLAETATTDIEAYCPGLDCAINCHLGLINVDKSQPSYDTEAGHSSTPYHNGTTVVIRHIPAGGELFKFYGDTWFVSRERIFGKIPLTESYSIALDLLKKLMALPVDAKTKEDLFYFLQNVNRGSFESRQLNAFPPDWSHVDEILEADHMGIWQQSHHVRDVKWLRENGRCIDNIRSDLSSVHSRGAFSTRHLKEGTVITTSPLHHLPDSSSLAMYNITQYNGDWIRMVDDIIGYQIILNYCFGHEQSTLLLCPYGGGVNYINHSPEPNVKIRWAVDFEIAHNHEIVTDGTIESFSGSTPLLAFDYVALRDIEPGEELFIDYGDSWQKAWDEHVELYETPPSYIPAEKFNSLMEHFPLRNEDEQVFDPYPANLQIRCHPDVLSDRPEVGLSNKVYVWPVSYGDACRILERFSEDNDIFYTVELEIWPAEDRERFTRDEEDPPTVTAVIKTDVPRSAIRFFDIPGSTEINWRDAFRHFIAVPDDMFPQKWRNKVEAKF